MATTPLLNRFTNDLTTLAQQGKLDPVIGRDAEIEQLIEIISRPQDNNAILIGDKGVGKTAIIEGVAQRISSGKVANALATTSIRQLDISLFIRGAGYRNTDLWKERALHLIEELSLWGNVTLFIAHPLDFFTEPYNELFNSLVFFLRSAISQDHIRGVIETLTPNYKTWQANDPQLSQQFHPIYVSEPSTELTIKMLQSVKERYEEFHKVLITDEAIDAAVHLSAKLVSDHGTLPGKAIDLMDEAAAKLRISAKTEPTNIHVGARDVAVVVASWTGRPLAEILDIKEDE